MSDQTSEATTLETWVCPSPSGKLVEPKIGPGEVSSDLNLRPDVDVLRFVKGYLTVDTADARYPLWRRWLDLSAPALGLRIVSEAEAEAINDPTLTAIACPVSETCPWRGPDDNLARSYHIGAHRPPDGEWYEPPKTITRNSAF